MDKNLLLEVRGRSLRLFAYLHENRVQEQIDRDLVAFAVEAERKNLTPKKKELGLKKIIDDGFKESEDGVLLSVAKDVLSNLKLVKKHLD